MIRNASRKPLPAYSVEFGVVAGIGFGRRLRATARLLDRVLAEALSEHGVTLSQYFILRELWDEEGPTLRELAARVNVAEPSTMATLDLMEERGLVTRTQSKADRRKTHVHLTPKGRALQKTVMDVVHRLGTMCFHGLRAAELSRAVDVFDKITANIERHIASQESP